MTAARVQIDVGPIGRIRAIEVDAAAALEGLASKASQVEVNGLSSGLSGAQSAIGALTTAVNAKAAQSDLLDLSIDVRGAQSAIGGLNTAVNQKLAISAKASPAETVSGSSQDKWVTPYGVKVAVSARIVEVASPENAAVEALADLIDDKLPLDFSGAIFDESGASGPAKSDLSNAKIPTVDGMVGAPYINKIRGVPSSSQFGIIANSIGASSSNATKIAAFVEAFKMLRVDRGRTYTDAPIAPNVSYDFSLSAESHQSAALVFPSGVDALLYNPPENLLLPNQSVLSVKNIALLSDDTGATATAIMAHWDVESFEKRFFAFADFARVVMAGTDPSRGWGKGYDLANFQHINCLAPMFQGIDGLRDNDGVGNGEQAATTISDAMFDISGGSIPTVLTILDARGMNMQMGLRSRGSLEGLCFTGNLLRCRDGFDMETTTFDPWLATQLGTANASGRPDIRIKAHVAAYRHVLKMKGHVDSRVKILGYRNPASTDGAAAMVAIKDGENNRYDLALKNYNTNDDIVGVDISGATFGAPGEGNVGNETFKVEFEGGFTKGVTGSGFNRGIHIDMRQADNGATFSDYDIDPVLLGFAETPPRLLARYVRRTTVAFANNAGALMPWGETPDFQAVDVLSGFADTEFRKPVGMGFRGLRFRIRLPWEANPTGLRKLDVMLNGATSALGAIAVQQPANSAGITYVDVDTFIPMDDDDVVTLKPEQSSGGTLNILANASVEVWGE